MVKTNESILAKYLFTVILTFIISLSIYHLLIRPYAIMRLLFGAKPRDKKEKIKIHPPSGTIIPQPVAATL